MPLARPLALLCLCLAATISHAADGLIAMKSSFPAKETMDRLEDLVKQRGLNVFNRIDHAAGAAKIGQSLRPTELLIFGNPQGGTPFMQCAQSVAIDLPLKALVWVDDAGAAWLGYNDPVWLARRHGAADCPAAANIARALDGIARAAAGRP